MEALGAIIHKVVAAAALAPPGALFLALTFLPLIGLPASPFWVATGARFGVLHAMLFCMASLFFNFSLGYWLARRWLRQPLARWMERRGHQIPRLEAGDQTRFILLLRVTPGVPLFVQNYLLGLAEVEFGRYLLLSFPVQAAYALGFVWLGDALKETSVWRFVLAVAALAAAGLAISLLRRYLARRKTAVAAHPASPGAR